MKSTELSSINDSVIKTTAEKSSKGEIWWSNAIFFIGMHVLALIGVLFISPYSQLNYKTATLSFASWQLAQFGITIGYHRCWSHKSFTASFPLRVVLAGMGCLGFQGSIKWWVLRHRLHHRFTDTESDPYNAHEGLYHSHVGWIFRKPNYPRMHLIDRKDLDLDPVVRFQHKYYLPLTLGLGLVLPTLLASLWDDALGGFIWGGVATRILTWHCTFLINSLAHYVGEQAYSEDLTAKGNLLLALLTQGEGNHNFHHAFPKDYRNGVRTWDWDPTKWTIFLLHRFTPFLVPKVSITPESDVLKAQAHVLSLQSARAKEGEEPITSTFSRWSGYESNASSSSDESDASSLFELSSESRRVDLPIWNSTQLLKNHTTFSKNSKKRVIWLLIDGYVLDCTNYLAAHPGGQKYFVDFSIKPSLTEAEVVWKPRNASDAFNGGYNNHGTSAKEKMKSLRISKFSEKLDSLKLE